MSPEISGPFLLGHVLNQYPIWLKTTKSKNNDNRKYVQL
jgi:hypothetical protein